MRLKACQNAYTASVVHTWTEYTVRSDCLHIFCGGLNTYEKMLPFCLAYGIITILKEQMKISEMIEQLEALKKQAGDVEVATYYGGSYECCQPVRYIELVEANNVDADAFKNEDGSENEFVAIGR